MSTDTPIEPENITPMTVPVDESAPAVPTPEQIAEVRQAVSDDMREAIPFNRDAIHVGFQRAIQQVTASNQPHKAGPICSAFRAWADGESLLRSE